MKTLLPDYDNCTVNLACSVLENFGVPAPHGTLAAADHFLNEKTYKNVIVLLLDAMGACITARNLSADSFFNRHLAAVYSSVFPSTTAAATTSIDSALYPSEHGWLGWDCYFSEIDRTVTVLLNRDSHTGVPIPDYHVAHTYCPYKSVTERIRESGTQAYISMPYAEPYPKTFDLVCERIQSLCALDGRKYIYAYWDEPDTTMHKTGCYSEKSKTVLQKLEQKVQVMCEKLAGTDTLLFITADHGHMDSHNIALSDYPDIMDCLQRPAIIEPRAAGFFVKPDCKDTFEKAFLSHFSDSFRLLKKDEVIASGLFGLTAYEERYEKKDSASDSRSAFFTSSISTGSRLKKMLADYLAVAVDTLSLYQTREKAARHIGTHAGLTEDEMRIPLIAIPIR